jgi:hypothetical protein
MQVEVFTMSRDSANERVHDRNRDEGVKNQKGLGLYQSLQA